MSDDVLGKLERIEDQLDEVRVIVKQMQLSDAEGRGDLKVIAGKLDNAATALANAAQSIQLGQLNGQKVSRWWDSLVARIGIAAIALVLVGERLAPFLVSLFKVSP